MSKDEIDMKTKKIWLGAAAVLALVGGGVAVAQTTATTATEKPMRGGKGGGMMMLDANKDGTITRAEATTAASTQFARMDANKDGKIDQADRQAMRAQMKTRAFDKLDANDDGAVSQTEFGNAGADRANRAPRADGDEMRGERKGRRGGHGGMGGRGFGGRGMGGNADTNGDKAISAAEFQTAALTRFDAMDGNKDGSVTKAEMDTARAAMKAQWQAKRAAAQSDSSED